MFGVSKLRTIRIGMALRVAHKLRLCSSILGAVRNHPHIFGWLLVTWHGSPGALPSSNNPLPSCPMKGQPKNDSSTHLKPIPFRSANHEMGEIYSERSNDSQASGHSTLKSLLLGLSISLIALAISLVLIEIGYRLVSSDSSVVAWSDRPQTYYLPEGAETLQDYSYAKLKPKNTFRIAVVGDSFSFAPQMQLDDAFPKRLERFLQLGTMNAQVLNFGVPGYSTHHEVFAVKKALKYNPDLILLQITLNDVQEKPYQPTGLRRDHGFGTFSSNSSLLNSWSSLKFALSRIHNSSTHERYVDYYFQLFDSPSNWKKFQSSIASIARRGQKKAVPVMSVIFPLFGLPLDDNYPFHPLHTRIEGTLEKFNIPFLDLFPAFQGLPLDRIQLVPGVDFHPNEIGHRIAAEQIYSWLKSTDSLPRQLFTSKENPTRIDILGRSHLESSVN